jgi:malonate decarboxylase alpha subunit
VRVGQDAGLPVAPVMVYGDDVTHVVTEEGVAYLYRARNLKERREALAAVAGVSPIGRAHDQRIEEQLRKDGLVAFPEDLGVRRADAKRSLLAAHSIGDLVEWSGGLYKPPDRFWSP